MALRRIESFQDATGTTREGYIERVSDFGGSDIVYRMRTLDGRVCMVSGSRIGTMQFERMQEV